MTKQKRLITFDLDGTLFDTAPEIALAVNRTLEAHGLTPLELDIVTGYIGHGTRELMREALAGLVGTPCPNLEEIMPLFDSHYDAVTGTLAQTYPGVPDALARLRSAGVRMAVVTNKEHRFAQRLLEAAGLAAHFDVVLGGDSLAYRKPHPLPILYCLELLGVPADAAAHLGDSRTDIESARRAGVSAWAVPYGYNHGEPIVAARPDYLFLSVEEVADHVVPLRCDELS